jgi:hypothetical protein
LSSLPGSHAEPRPFSDSAADYERARRPEYWEPVFAISNEPVFSASTLYSTALAFTDNHPFRVIAGGLGKAAATEFAMLERKISSFFKPRSRRE